jgi:hypothetical protein
MTNKFKPHVLVLPEDDANRQIANGFLSNSKLVVRAIQVLPIVGGWQEDIGEALSQDCSNNTQKAWGHEMLKHNEAELKRLIKFVKPFLFALD